MKKLLFQMLSIFQERRMRKFSEEERISYQQRFTYIIHLIQENIRSLLA